MVYISHRGTSKNLLFLSVPLQFLAFQATKHALLSGSSLKTEVFRDVHKIFAAIAAVLVLTAALAACTSKQDLEDPPIITSATYQHTLYNGRGQPIEAKASKEGAPSPVVTYFRSEEDLLADRDGSSEAPAEVGDYYVRIRRPAGKGYRAGNDITVEYHIQKALVIISAEARQEFAYDGKPKAVAFSVDRNVEPDVAYYHSASAMRGFPLSEPPTERGAYRAVISWTGDARYMGASKEVALVIR